MAYGSRGDIEPMLGLAVRLREFDADMRMVIPPVFVKRVTEAGGVG